MVTYRYGGGRPPPSLEMLTVEASGAAQYLAGNAWPRHPPFNEAGAYAAHLDRERVDRLHALARALVASPPAGIGPADAGTESLGVDDLEADWSPEARPAGAAELKTLVDAIIVELRERPLGAVRAELGPDSILVIEHRGEAPVAVADGAARVGLIEQGRSVSPLSLAGESPTGLELPASLAPGDRFEVACTAPQGPGQPAALVSLRWQAPDGEWLDGWLTVAGG